MSIQATVESLCTIIGSQSILGKLLFVNPLKQLHLLDDIPQDGTDLQTYPEKFTGNYEIAYGILRSSTDLNADKIYDFHTAFDIEPTKVKMNAPIDMNRQKILNFNRYVINVWNCHFKKILEVEDNSVCFFVWA